MILALLMYEGSTRAPTALRAEGLEVRVDHLLRPVVGRGPLLAPAVRVLDNMVGAPSRAAPRGDMEVDRDPGFVEEVPHGGEVGLVELRQPDQLGLVGEREPPDALVEQPGHLLDREIHVPHRQRLGEQAVARLVLDVDLKSL